MKCSGALIIALLGLVTWSGTSLHCSPAPTNTIASFELQDEYRAWQGIAIDSKCIYVLTDRNEHFDLENIISVYTHSGERVRERRNAYAGKDSKGRFMSFGDGNIIDEALFVTAYNINSGGCPSKVGCSDSPPQS